MKTAIPMLALGTPAPIGQPPLASPPSPSDAANDIALTLNVSPVLPNTLTNGIVPFTSSPPRTYMGDGFTTT